MSCGSEGDFTATSFGPGNAARQRKITEQDLENLYRKASFSRRHEGFGTRVATSNKNINLARLVAVRKGKLRCHKPRPANAMWQWKTTGQNFPRSATFLRRQEGSGMSVASSNKNTYFTRLPPITKGKTSPTQYHFSSAKCTVAKKNKTKTSLAVPRFSPDSRRSVRERS